ncbi:MAG: tetratricopeptide repeat protein [Oligoflexia bacterium]|nr:tetratricopeptide repeat protein [Oligoflexia bacterium]
MKNLGIVAWFWGSMSRRSYYEQSLAIYQDIGDQAGASDTLNNLGLLAWGQGRYEQSAAYYQQSLRIKEQIGDRLQMGIMLGNLGIMCRTQGSTSRRGSGIYKVWRFWRKWETSLVRGAR